MKKIYALLTALILIVVSSFSLQAQCPYNNSIYVTLTAPSTVGASIGTGDCIFPGEYYRVTGMQAGSVYRISTCTTTDVADTRVTVYAAGGSGGALTFNDDFCGLLSRVDFAPTTTGSYDILVDQTGPGNTCTSISECVEMTITLIGTSGNTAYCIPTYVQGTANGDFINGVNLGSINNQNSGSVGGPSYSDFTNLSAFLNVATAYTLSIKNNPDFQEIASAWIDYNQDFEFSEDERLGQVSINANATGLINFTTPSNILPGNTRMRVRMVFSVSTTGGSVPACASANFGETEDYTVSFSTNNPPVGPGALSFVTNCGIGATIQDNACPNATLASVDVGGLTVLGTNHVLSSAEIIISHPMAADLDLYLQAPNGAIVELSTDNGGSGSNYGIYTLGNCSQTALFSMSAATPIAGSSAPFVGSYIPEGDLNDFNSGTNPNGLWRLRACDDFAGDIGTIEFFKLNFALNATEPPACADSYSIQDGATNISLDQLINWTAGSGNPTAYDVYFGTDDQNLALVSNGQAGTSYAPGVLLASTTYYYQIVPSNNAGDAVGCPVIAFTTVAEGTPGILMGNGEVTVCEGNFYDSGGVNGNYENDEIFSLTMIPSTPNSAIQVDFSAFNIDDLDLLVIVDGPDEFSDVIGIYSGTSGPTTVTATNPQGVLTFLFISDGLLNLSGWEATISCVPAGSVPACVASSTPADQSFSVSINALLSWTEGSGNPTGYDIYFGTNPSPALVATGITLLGYDPGTLENSTTYYYQIVPTNGNGAAVGCDVYSFTTEAAPSNVILMQDASVEICDGFFYDSGNSTGDYSNDESYTLTLTPATVGSAIQVAFASFQTEEEFDVLEVYSGVGTSGPLLATLSGTLASLPTFTSVSVDGALTFVFSSDFQVPSEGWSASIACVPMPIAPECATNLVPIDGSIDTDAVVTLTWEAGNGDPILYDVYFGDASDNLTLVSEGQTSTSFQTQTLTGATTYFWQVVPSNLVGAAADCAVLSFTTVADGTAPSCVVSASPADVSTDVDVASGLSWSAGLGDAPAAYDVFFGTESGNLTLVSEGQVGTTYQPASLDFETTYFWLVVPSNEFGSAADCAELSFTTAAEVVVTDIIQTDGITVTACSGNFYDSGSFDGDYNLNEASIMTIAPAIAGNFVQVDFTLFDIEEDWDFLTIYDGNSNAAPIIGTYTGAASPGTVLSTAVDGSLTFEFTSDVSFALAGWEATVSCIDPNAAPSCATNYSPSNLSTGVSFNPTLAWTSGGGVVTGYDVYFGTDAGNLTLVSNDQIETTFSVGTLELGTTYFWQIVPVGQVSSALNCTVQSFTTESVSAILQQEGAITICSANFFDSGGESASYSANESSTLVLTPEVAGNVLEVIFTSFNIENNFEFLQIFDGNSIASPLIGEFTGTISPGSVVSTATDGSLTFLFTSDTSVQNAGWSASVNCIDPAAIPNCVTSIVPANNSADLSLANLNLSWISGGGAVTGYDVYFGTDAGSLVLVSANQAELTYTPVSLELNTTYYWQVAPINANGTATDCPVNSFTTSSVQDVVMANATVITCSANFFDSGAATGSYQNNESSTLTFTPDQANNSIQVVFNAFDLEQSTFTGTIFDSLLVYDGPDATSPLIGIFSGTTIPGPFVSSHPSGSLTFYFSSDASVVRTGWAAVVSCIPTGAVPNCVTSLLPADLSLDVTSTTLLTWTSGGGIVTGYDVYFGTDPGALTLVSDNQVGTSFNPAPLELSTTYFWQVVPSNESGSAVDCPVLSFTTGAEITLNIFNGETTLCAGNLFDTGGPTANYLANENITLTVYPSTPGSFLQADFVSFNIEGGFDFLNVYDGNSANGPADYTFTGNAIPAQIISSAVDGSLTFVFTSDAVVTAAGFEISLSCFTPSVAPSCSDNYFPTDADPSAPLNSTLSWNGVGFPTSFDVYFGTDSGNLTLVGEGVSVSSFNPGPLLPNTEYFWQIVPANAIGTAEGCPVLSFTTSDSEVINMFTGTATTCLANFFDPQGATANYLNDQNNTLTVNPASPDNVMRVTFNVFNVENNFEFLTIYAGQTATGTPLATLTGNQAGPIVVTSNTVDGALTFVWTSDGSVTNPGWEAVLECVSTLDAPGCVVNPVPADGAVEISPSLAILSWGLGSGIAFDYDVYFGTDPGALALVSPDQVATLFNPGELDLNTTYYWQIIPANGNGAAEGCEIYSFTTSGSIDIVMSNATITTCSANFFDSGNATGNYLNNENLTLTIFPDQPGNSIQVLFTAFNLENNFDFLTIFNGNSAAAPSLGTFTNISPAAVLSAPFTSSAPDGSLTFVFTSDGSVNRPGWTATVTCIDATQPPSCVNLTGGPLDGAVDVCLNEAVLTWSSGPGAPATSYDVYVDFGGGLVLVSDNQIGTTFDPGLLEPNTTYSYQIVPSNLNGEAVNCPINTFTTGTCLTYCDAAATTCDEFISDVQMGNINNPTDCTVGGYNDYTAQSTDVYIGAATPIVVTNGNLNWPTDVCGVWIDWNHDGDFADANEAITMAGSPGTGPYSAQIIAPIDAVVGPTTMRVRIQFGGVLNPCGTTTFGEVEDYTIIVNAPLACAFPNNISSSETTTTSTVITWDENVDALEYSIRYRLTSEDESVATWVTPLIVPAPLTFTFLENLEICENYVLQIASICEIGATEVVYSSNLNFGTRCIECTSDLTLEGEDCGTDVNGGCNSTPAAYGSISCGETICATSFMNATTRDTDWYNFTVTDAGIYQIEVLAEFSGTVFIANTEDCANIVIPSQANFNAGEAFTLGSSLNPGTYTVIIVPIFEQAIFGCTDFNAYTITLSSGETQIATPANVCTSTAPFNLFAVPAGGIWSGNGIIDAANGTFDASSVGVGSYEVTYTPVGSGCAVPATITIDVEEAPSADFVGLAATYCSSASAEDVVLTGIPAGGTFSISPSIVGAIAGNIFRPSLCVAGTYEITYVVSIGSGSCAGSITQSVEILDSPVASIDNLPTDVCSQDVAITLVATPAGGVFSGSGVTGDVFNPMMAGTGSVQVTYTLNEVGAACPAIATGTIQVNPSPVVVLSGIQGDYCLNSNPVTLIGTPALGQFLVDGNPSGASFDPAAAGLGSHTVRYEFDNGTCIGYDEVVVNVVNNISLAFVGVPATVCSADDPFILQTNPAGAIFSGIGVFGSTFSPKIAGVGSHVITATYSNGNCTATATQTIVVNPSPVASFIYSANGATIAFNNTSLNATSYSWDFGDGSPASTSVNPSHTYQTNGSYVITLTANSANCGSSTFTATLELSVGIGSIDGVDMIQLYPNPTNGIINLAFNSLNQQSFEVRITDATGRLIATDALTNYMGKFNKQYDLSEKAKGVYFFTITSEKGAINFRVVRD